jgi:hypothetical protein
MYRNADRYESEKKRTYELNMKIDTSNHREDAKSLDGTEQ